ncbi:hypothetical protein [Streptomyces sp. NPDC048489]
MQWREPAAGGRWSSGTPVLLGPPRVLVPEDADAVLALLRQKTIGAEVRQ